nr:phage major capsid protein [Streptococcus anginosus]
MKPQIAEQFYKKFDEAGLLNVDNPFAQSVEQSVKTSGNVVNGPITLENVLSLEDELLEHDVEANA